jgi:nucleoid-associated protein YgaU
MRSRNGAIAAVLVLAGGLGLALMFFRQSPPLAETTARSSETIRHRAADGPRFLMEVRSATPPQTSLMDEPGPPTRQEPTGLISGLPLFEAGDESVPRISRQYPSTDAPLMPPPTATRHAIIDGDTLASVAEQYLGDAARAKEVFEANRDVLTDPELLPIGAVLKIPARTSYRLEN